MNTHPLAFLFTLSSIFLLSQSLDTIPRTQTLKDGKTIVSSANSFEFGFFTPNGSTNRYLGIWYKQISTFTPVWVANRESPLTDSSSTLRLNDRGVLLLQNSTNFTIWSTNTSRTAVQNPVVQLLESGNLVVRESNDAKPENYLWQSFDYPGDTHLPGMKLGKNLVTGKEWHISSWKTSTDPALGTYSYWLDVRGFPQIFMTNGNVDLYRSGPWNGIRFSGTPSLSANSIYSFELNILKDEIYYTYHLLNTSVVTRFLMNSNGNAQRLNWLDRTKEWIVYRNVPTDSCDAYKLCGAYGNCLIDKTPICSCLRKFVPKNPSDWRSTDWSGGCVRGTTLECGNGEGFLKYTDIKLPDTRNSQYNMSMSLKECEQVCLKNCSCTAYTTLDIRNGGSGCLLWFDDLVDMKQFGPGTGQEIYIRMASSDLEAEPQSGSSSNKKRTTIIAITTVLGGLFLLGLCLLLVLQRRKKKSKPIIAANLRQNSKNSYADRSGSKDDLELPLFDFDTIASSTNNFSPKNKLGEGGFGPVYKGKLEGGQEIAVKQLSSTSKQGLDEFKNEVICIAKLQHRNLVKLLGCCIHGEERLLVYEYMVNNSLNNFIFDESRRSLLDWPKRYNIINGIARGLLYLHQDSRLRIIHRDLKASNILLDADLNPKISDFGMARSFGGNETQGNTNTVVGTYGYMSPEYAVDGLFSVKSDVFSFGVLVMEIIAGKRNRGFNHPDHDLNLLGHAWTLYKEDRQMELIDVHAKDSCVKSEVLRSIHIALLCVQQNPEDRPSMATVVLTMGSEGVLPAPKKPGFFLERNMDKNDTSTTTRSIPGSVDDFTITVMEPR